MANVIEINLSDFLNLLPKEDFLVAFFYDKIIKERFREDRFVDVSDLPRIPYPEIYAVNLDFDSEHCTFLNQAFNRNVNLVLFKNGKEKFRFTNFTDIARIEKKINNIKNTLDIQFLSDLPGMVDNVCVDVLDHITIGQKLLELQIDKATVEFFSSIDGIVLNVNIFEEQIIQNQQVMFTVLRHH